jgi:hypothetical protein
MRLEDTMNELEEIRRHSPFKAKYHTKLVIKKGGFEYVRVPKYPLFPNSLVQTQFDEAGGDAAGGGGGGGDFAGEEQPAEFGAGGDSADAPEDEGEEEEEGAEGGGPDPFSTTGLRAHRASASAGAEASAAEAVNKEAIGLYDAVTQAKLAVDAEKELQGKLDVAADKAEEMARKIAKTSQESARLTAGLYGDVKNVDSRMKSVDSAIKLAKKARLAATEAQAAADEVETFTKKMTALARTKEQSAMEYGEAALQTTDAQAHSQTQLQNAMANEAALAGYVGRN